MIINRLQLQAAGGVKISTPAQWRKPIPPLRVAATCPGESLVQVSASHTYSFDDFIHHRPREPVLLLTMPIIAGFELLIVVAHYLPQWRSAGSLG
jgi:hypothetical protein